jgi:hypothetical protein
MQLPPMGVHDRIDRALLKSHGEKKRREYLGASLLGEECTRRVYYEYYFPKPIDDARRLRIFQVGNLFEDYVIKLLKNAGIKVFTEDENEEQFGFIAFDGKVAGHIDGVVKGIPESTKPHLLEIKSANDASFKQFKKSGVKKQSDRYYGQVQIYMGEMNLEKCLFVIINKNTQELYFERIDYCIFEHKVCMNKAEEILNATEPPERAYNNSNFYRCNMCPYREECWELDS